MQRILITSAIPYINGIKHLGNLIGSQLPADLYARFMRARGHEVLFLCATDEHGTPAELAAKKAGEDVASFCKKTHAKQAKIAEGFRLSFDHFGRSSSPENHRLTQYFAGKLDEAGLIVEVTEKQMYSKTDQRFLPDRYIVGICPDCAYEHARGDQCENCTKQLNPSDLIEPRSAISGTKDIVVKETKHLHLRQSAMREHLNAWIESKKDWPILTTSIAKKWLNDGDGLQDRGITRDLDWGVPVKRGEHDWPGMDGKVFYVWFDAPIEYIACAAEWATANGKSEDVWQSWWRSDKGSGDVRYVQFMGKDNVPFHTLSFPATIMGANDGWKLVDYIKSFNYLTYEGGQFSTSQGRGIFQDQALELLPPDYWRWWLLSHAPENADSEFTWENFSASINKDLADVLGNFVSRTTKFCQARFGLQIPQGDGATYRASTQALWEKLAPLIADYTEKMENIEIRKAAAALRAIWGIGNEFLQSQAPWAVFKQDPEKSAALIRCALNLIPLYATLSRPFLPDSAQMFDQTMNYTHENWPESVECLDTVPPGHEFQQPGILFQKITNEMTEDWKNRFAGHSSQG